MRSVLPFCHQVSHQLDACFHGHCHVEVSLSAPLLFALKCGTMAVDAAVATTDDEVAGLTVLPSRSKRRRPSDDTFVRRTSRGQVDAAVQQPTIEDDERTQQFTYGPPPPRRAAIKARRATKQTLAPQKAQRRRASRGHRGGKVSRKSDSKTGAKAHLAAKRATSSSSRSARPTIDQQAASSAASSTARRSAKYVEFDELPLVGVGLKGLGFGANLTKMTLSLEWLKEHHSVRQLPVSKADKERLINGSGGDNRRDGITYSHFPWCKIGAGWYVGEWVKKCRLTREQREAAHTPRKRATQQQDEADVSSQPSDEEAEEVIDNNSGHPSDDAVDGDSVEMQDGPKEVEDAEYEQSTEGVDDEDERDAAAMATVDSAVDGKEEAQISPLKLQRKRGRQASWQRHECTNSCWEMRGYGYQVTAGGVQFLGQFAGGALNDAHGIIIDSSGIYCGGVVKGADEGCGCFYYRANNDLFTGMWRQGAMQYGSVLYGDQNTMYTGSFFHNKQDGLGVYDVLTPATENSIVQHVGEWKGGTWNGVGKAVYANRTVTGKWMKEETQQGSVGLIEWVNEEGMKITYVGDMSETSEGCGHGRLRWEERSAGEKRQHEHDDKRRAEVAAKRKKHIQRRCGDWSSLADIEKQQKALAEQIDSLASTLASLPTVELPFTSPSSSLYTGAVQHSRAHGHGYRQWANGDIFCGHWVDGVCNGLGSWLSQDRHDSLGSILYSGCWKNDKEHGRGTLLSSMPLLGRMLFHGRFVDGWLTGMGSVYFADSGQLYYVGRMAGGAFDGEGVMRLEDGSLYVGGFVDGTFRGRGRWVDTRECSVYTGRFKHDYKHGCGRLTIHLRLDDKSKVVKNAVEQPVVAVGTVDVIDIADIQQMAVDGGAELVEESAHLPITAASEPAVSSSALAVSSERSDSEIVRDLSATKYVTPEEALATCHHAITLPHTFGQAARSYLAIYNRDKPVIRIVGDDLDALLDEIEYDVDDADVDEDGLFKEEQVDTTREEKRKQRQRKASKSKVAAVVPPPQDTDTERAKEQASEGEKEIEQDIGEAACEMEGNGMLILRHYQDELDRIHKLKAVRKRSRKDKAHVTAASSSSSTASESSLLSTGSPFLRQSLSQPPPPLTYFAPSFPSPHLRRIHLERAIGACNDHNVCSAAVTGQLPADYTVHYCVTCSRGGPGEDQEEEQRVEVCGACKAAGCHRGHQLRPVRVVDKGMEGDPSNGEAALFYCHCTLHADRCRTKMRDFSAAIDRASMWTEHEEQQPVEMNGHVDSQPALIQQSEASGSRQPNSTDDLKQSVSPATDVVVEQLDTGALPAPLKPSELRALSAQFVQRAAPIHSEALASLPVPASSSLPPPSSFRSLFSVLSSSSLLPLSLPSPVRKAGPRWVKVDGKWVEEKSS